MAVGLFIRRWFSEYLSVSQFVRCCKFNSCYLQLYVSEASFWSPTKCLVECLCGQRWSSVIVSKIFIIGSTVLISSLPLSLKYLRVSWFITTYFSSRHCAINSMRACVLYFVGIFSVRSSPYLELQTALQGFCYIHDCSIGGLWMSYTFSKLCFKTWRLLASMEIIRRKVAFSLLMFSLCIYNCNTFNTTVSWYSLQTLWLSHLWFCNMILFKSVYTL